MLAEELKTRARDFISAFNEKSTSILETMIADNFVQHSPGVPPSREAFFRFLEASFSAFPDGRFHVQDMIAEGDKVLVRWSFYGTHLGVWLYRPDPPTGRRIDFCGMDLWRYDSNGRLAEAWFIGDMLGLMKQLGRIPS